MANQHFFQPLLPGFHSHLTIPVVFFLKNIEGRYEQKTAELRSDASKIIWKVKIDGRRLTDGWKEFALSHDLQVGDIVIFRHERDLAFHVTLLGPSCCEVQYGSCLEDQNNLEKIQRKNPRRETESSSLDPSCFVAKVSPSSLRYDTLYLPKRFVRANSVVTGSGEIVLMNEKGSSWTLNLKQKQSCGTVYTTRGWRSFCGTNGLRAGDIVTFKLCQRGATLALLRLSTKEPEEETNEVESLSTEPEIEEESNIGKIQRKKNPRRETESSSVDPSCFVGNIAASTLRYDSLYLPKKFVRENGVDTKCGEIVLMNEKGRSWTLKMKQKQSCGTTYIRRGWRSFCRANGLRAGSFFTFKLIKKGRTQVLRLSRKELEEEEEEECSETNEVESLSTETESDEESNLGKKNPRREAESSSVDSSCFVANVTPATLRYDRLNLPKCFVRKNCLEKRCGEIVLMNEKGISWTLELKGKNSHRVTYIRGGWRSFCHSNGLRAGSFFTFKLIQRVRTLVLRLSPTESEEEESSDANEVESVKESNEEEKNSHECSKSKEMKRGLVWKAPATASQNRFVTLTLTPSNVSLSRLNLPVPFIKVSGIKKAKKMYLLDKHGVKWSTKLQLEKERKRIKLVGGWKEFCEANGVKIGESIILELIWEGDRSSVLKFCSKMMPENK